MCAQCERHAVLYTEDFGGLDGLPETPPMESTEPVGLVRCSSCGYLSWVYRAVPI